MHTCAHGAACARGLTLIERSAVFCAAPALQPCVRCGQACWTKIGRWRIHKTCNDQYINERRSHPSHDKRMTSTDGAATHLLAAAAAIAGTGTPPMANPTECVCRPRPS
jgi:hypothetical protein